MDEFIERNGRRFELGGGDTADRVADVLVHLAAHQISERDFVAWVGARITS